MNTNLKIADKFEIGELIQLYGKALDEKKYSLLEKVFTPNAQLVYLLGEQLIKLPFSESDNLFKEFLTRCYWTSHLISQPVVEITGDIARSTSHVTATHIQVKENGDQNIWIVSGAYEDELVRSNEGWRINKRVANAPYVEGNFMMEGVREFTTYQSVDESGNDNSIG